MHVISLFETSLFNHGTAPADTTKQNAAACHAGWMQLSHDIGVQNVPSTAKQIDAGKAMRNHLWPNTKTCAATMPNIKAGNINISWLQNLVAVDSIAAIAVRANARRDLVQSINMIGKRKYHLNSMGRVQNDGLSICAAPAQSRKNIWFATSGQDMWILLAERNTTRSAIAA